MADVKKFDIYKDNKKVVDAKPSPLQITGLKPATKYSGYQLAYAGEPDKTAIADFTTAKAIMASFTVDRLKPNGDAGTKTTVTVKDIAPADTTNKTVKATSKDTSIVTVKDNGNGAFELSLVKAGKTNVDFASVDGGAKLSIEVTVNIPVVHVTGVTLDKSEVSIEQGQSVTVKATVAPSNASDKSGAWKSGNAEVATVDQAGKITGVKAGTLNAVFTTKDGAKTASVAVTVTEPAPADPEPTEPPAEG